MKVRIINKSHHPAAGLCDSFICRDGYPGEFVGIGCVETVGT